MSEKLTRLTGGTILPTRVPLRLASDSLANLSLALDLNVTKPVDGFLNRKIDRDQCRNLCLYIRKTLVWLFEWICEYLN